MEYASWKVSIRTNSFSFFFIDVYPALTVFVVVQVDSLRATSLIHAGKFTKLLNTSSTSSTTASPSTSSEAPSSDRLRELLEELPDDEEGVS